MVTATRPTLGDDARSVAWWVFVGTAAGAIAGCLVGGIGGRLAMLLLRLTPPDSVTGLTSDDGFEIGVVTTKTLSFILGMTFLGAGSGVIYAVLRGAIPGRLRLPLWALAVAAAGGAQFVHEDGIDFHLLEPAALAVALFVALPGLAAALVVVLVERWIVRDPAADRRLFAGLVVAAVAGTFALVIGGLVGVIALGMRRAGATELVRPIAKVAVPLVLVAVTLVAGVSLVSEASRII